MGLPRTEEVCSPPYRGENDKNGGNRMGNKLTALGQLRTSMAQAKTWTQNQVADVAQAAAEAVEEMGQTKADKAVTGRVTIPAEGWEKMVGDVYVRRYDIPVSGVTAQDRADLVLAPASIRIAAACGLCPTVETVAGGLRLLAQAAPGAEMTAEYRLYQ